MLNLNLGKPAKRYLEKLPPKHFRQIDRKIEELRRQPFPQDSKLLSGCDLYRVDSGEYRIVYKVIGEILYVPLIGKRNDDEVYKRLRRLLQR